MRLSRRQKQYVALGLFVLVLLIGFFPMRFALSLSNLTERGVAARSVEGSIWSARIFDLRAGPLPVGDVDARVRALPLLLGRIELVLEREPNPQDAGLSAVIVAQPGGFAVRNAVADIATAGAFAPLPVGNIKLSDFNLEIADGTCRSASGTVGVDVSANLMGLAVQRGLSGRASCRGEALFVPLRGESGLEQLDLTIHPDGRYDARFTIAAMGSELMLPLAALGFRASGADSMTLDTSGRF